MDHVLYSSLSTNADKAKSGFHQDQATKGIIQVTFPELIQTTSSNPGHLSDEGQ